MKIFKANKIVIAVVAAIISVSIIPFFQSCSNDDILNTSQEIGLGVQRISITDIPKGIVPKAISSSELKNIKNELSKLYYKNERVSSVTKVASGKYEVCYKNTIKNTRLKAPGEKASDTKDGFWYDIVVECSCPKVNSSNVMLTSRATNFLGAYYDWKQQQVSGKWGKDGDSWYLEYEITATVDQYVICDGEYFISRKEVNIQGIIYF